MEGVQGKIQGPGDETQGTGREEKGQVWYRYLLQVVPLQFTAMLWILTETRNRIISDPTRSGYTGLVYWYSSLGLCC